MKNGIAFLALWLTISGGGVFAETIDPTGPELPGTISADGNFVLNGLVDPNVYNPAPLLPGNDDLAVEFQATDTTTGDTEQFYDVFQVPAPTSGTTYEIDIPVPTGAAADPLRLGDAAYWLSPTLIPLDQLNSPTGETFPDPLSGSINESGSLSDGTLTINFFTPLPKADLGVVACLGMLAALKFKSRQQLH